MPLRVRPSLLVSFPALAAACADWPRFTAEDELVGEFEQFRPREYVEVEDWPDDPAGAAAMPPAELAVAMDSVRFRGELDPFGAWVEEAGTVPFPGCPGITSGIAGRYEGDVDVVRIRHPGRSLCLHLSVPGANASEPWDVVAYAWNGNCAVGPFLTEPWAGHPDIPATTGPGLTSSAEAAASPEIVVYVASGTKQVAGEAPGATATAYALDVVATWDAGTCIDLQSGNFGEPR